jgi:hypothetical protein
LRLDNSSYTSLPMTILRAYSQNEVPKSCRVKKVKSTGMKLLLLPLRRFRPLLQLATRPTRAALPLSWLLNFGGGGRWLEMAGQCDCGTPDWKTAKRRQSLPVAKVRLSGQRKRRDGEKAKMEDTSMIFTTHSPLTICVRFLDCLYICPCDWYVEGVLNRYCV